MADDAEAARRAQEADDAAIARLLMEDQSAMYGDAPNPYSSSRYSNKYRGVDGNDSECDDDEAGMAWDDDWTPAQKRRAKARAAAARKKRKRSPSPTENAAGGEDVPAPRKRARKPAQGASGDSITPLAATTTAPPPDGLSPLEPAAAPAEPGDAADASEPRKRKPSRPWGEEEEARFLAGLELFGRDWRALAEHVGNDRDPNAIRSHAQKYFIRLCRDAKPLPAKVAESGVGYTLSGKPLDLDSASARCYLRKDRETVPIDALPPGSFTVGPAPAAAAAADGGEATQQQPAAEAPPKPPRAAPLPKPPRAAPLPKPPKPPKLPKPPKPAKQPPARPPSSGTHVEVRRSGRERRATQAFGASADAPDGSGAGGVGGDEDDLTLVKARAYAAETQPFAACISVAALFTMDLHAHLACTEIIGLLGGSWNAETRTLAVVAAFPCAALADGEDSAGVSVELDPESAIEAKQRIAEAGLCVVGWYHSHPIFEPDPSVRDIHNQHGYQQWLAGAETGFQPFLGVILGPYDVRMLTPRSVVNVFHVVAGAQAGALPQPMHIVYAETAAPQPPAGLDGLLRRLVAEYEEYAARVIPHEVWRYGADLKPMSRAEKLTASLQAWVAQDGVREAWAPLIAELVETFGAWR